ncbi:MAG TPA: glycosyltransferase family 4 protein [Burkholderiaceae bacterium]
MSRPLRLLTFTTLFPSSVRPGHGIFVETRLRELMKSGQVESRVVAPVPWFPSRNPRFGSYARIAATPAREARNGLDVLHPRYLLAPKIGMIMAPLTLALGARAAIRRLIEEGFDFDVIDAHYFYPDGVAAALLGWHFKKPFTITARGSDLNLIPRFRLPRRMMQWAASKAAALIGVCAALVDVLRGWRLSEAKLHVMRNGVDLERFQPLPREDMRRQLGLGAAPVLLSVGNLVELKGHKLLVQALARLLPEYPDAQLVIIGEGPERAGLEQLARDLGVQDRLRLTGALPNTELSRWYSAADLSVLASSREGWANVLLESMACGTPVVATDVGGSAEVMGDSIAGVLVRQRDPESLAQAMLQLLLKAPDRSQVRAYAEQFSWQATTNAQLSLFAAITSKGEAHA